MARWWAWEQQDRLQRWRTAVSDLGGSSPDLAPLRHLEPDSQGRVSVPCPSCRSELWRLLLYACHAAAECIDCRQVVTPQALQDLSSLQQQPAEPASDAAAPWQSLLTQQEAQQLQEAQRQCRAVYAVQKAKVGSSGSCRVHLRTIPACQPALVRCYTASADSSQKQLVTRLLL